MRNSPRRVEGANAARVGMGWSAQQKLLSDTPSRWRAPTSRRPEPLKRMIWALAEAREERAV